VAEIGAKFLESVSDTCTMGLRNTVWLRQTLFDHNRKWKTAHSNEMAMATLVSV